MSNQSFVNKLLQSFGHALEGFPLAFSDRNMKIHGLAAGVVIFAGWWFQISKPEWLVVFLLIGAIWALEMVNSAIEELSNTVRDSLKLDRQATKKPRDLAAGAVLLMAIISVICAVIILLPHMVRPVLYGPPAY